MKNFASSVILAAVVALLANLAITLPLKAATPAVCSVYAASAVSQNQKNKQMNCGFTGSRWMSKPGLHYSWCLGASNSAVQAETNKRAAMLASCGGGGSTVKNFVNPKYKGLRLDWCYKWGAECGAYAAKAYCVYRGYPLVKGFGKAENIGSYTKTRVFSTSQVCNGPDCDGFTYIKCSK